MLLASTDAWILLPATLFSPVSQPFQQPPYEYGITIVGAGASGLLAAGVASSVGFKTLLIERAQIDGGAPGRVEFNVGGDCMNAACVPSKAIRSIAKVACASSSGNSTDHDPGHRNRSNKWLELARRQANYAVGRVRAREDPNRIVDVPNLELEFVKDCKFISTHLMRLKCYSNSTWIQGLNGTVSNAATTSVVERVITSRKFLIATGASPVLPEKLTKAAEDAGVPYLTYRSLLRPTTSRRYSTHPRRTSSLSGVAQRLVSWDNLCPDYLGTTSLYRLSHQRYFQMKTYLCKMPQPKYSATITVSCILDVAR
jgi:hypothetical protein